jgi:hypothetical protein
MNAPRVVNVHQAKTHLSRLIDDAHAGETILLSVMFSRSAVSNRRRSLLIPIILISAIPIGLIVGPRYAPVVWILLFFADAARFRRSPDRQDQGEAG